MHKMIKSFLLLALFGLASAILPLEQVNAAKPVQIEKNGSKFVSNLVLQQVGLGTVLATWNATTNGPFTVSVVDLGTGARVQQFSTTVPFALISGLNAGTKYRITVGDVNMISADIVVL